MSIDDFTARVSSILQALGIDEGVPAAQGLLLWRPPTVLSPVELRPDGKAFLLTREAGDAWRKMRLAAADDNIVIKLVSAYRSLDHQETLIRRKLAQGMPIKEILKFLAPPGYSEHHSGTAIDIGGTDLLPFDEEFENSPAYLWLAGNANRFGFFLSFPRDNFFGYVHEPWHWRYIASQ